MSKFLKKSLALIPRTGHWVNYRKNYLTMERNERVDEFSKTIIKDLKKNIHSFDLRTYPDDINQIYDNLSKWLRIKRDQLIITDGADGGLLRVFSVFADKDDKIFYLNPSYAMYPVYCEIFKCNGFKFNIYPGENKKKVLKKILQSIKKIKPKIIALANPNQPIEIFFNKQELMQILRFAKKSKSLVVIDEAYYHFSNFSAITLIKKFDNLIVVRTFSKAFGLAGLRIGYSISNKKIIDSMKIIKPIYEINNINIKICNYFLKNINIMKKYVKDVSISRKYFHKQMKKIKIPSYGSFSNTVLIKFESENAMKKIFKNLYKKKVIVKPSIFYNKFYLRCTLGSLKPTKILIRLIKKYM